MKSKKNTGYHPDKNSPAVGTHSGILVFASVFLATGIIPSAAVSFYIIRKNISFSDSLAFFAGAAIIVFLLITGCIGHIVSVRFRIITDLRKARQSGIDPPHPGRLLDSGMNAGETESFFSRGTGPAMEHILDETEFAFENILSAISDMVFVFDVKTRFTFAHVPDNRNRFFPLESFLGKTHNEVMPEEIHGPFNEAFDRCRSGEFAEYEYGLVISDEERWFLARMSPVMKDGLFDGSVAVVRDITQRKHAEEKITSIMADLKRSNTDLHEFALVASHDLKDPLVTVGGYLRRLQRKYTGIMEQDARQLLMRAVSGVLRMERLINEVLSLSHLSANPLVFGEVDCNTALAEAVENLEEIIEKDGAVIISDPLPIIQGEHPLIVELFQNLLSNSIKHHVIRPPRIVISAVLKSDDWEFFVADNGPGISAEHADKIFHIFARFDQVHPEGSGIGLAVCKKIVELHGGRIWVESTAGKGSTFRFTIPARKKQAKTTGTEKNSTG